GNMLTQADEQQKEDRQAETDEQILHRMDRQAVHDLVDEKSRKGQQHEENAVFHRARGELVGIDWLEQADDQSVHVPLSFSDIWRCVAEASDEISHDAVKPAGETSRERGRKRPSNSGEGHAECSSM